ncbi:MAG: trigger factor, partial [Bacteroidetes bacterium]|nr:trigger factor [Bacteroidota bacterium]
MDITLDKKNSTEAFIKIKLKENDYQPKVEEKIKDYSRKANLKGFRPGKVPNSLIRKMYGKSILVEEINHLLAHSLTDYLKEQDLQILGEPLPDLEKTKNIDWDNQKEFEFEYNIGFANDFKYDLSKIKKVQQYEIKIDDKTLNETIENLRIQHGAMTNPEITEESDSIFGEFSDENGEITNKSLLLIVNIEKKERKKFIGIKKEDTINFDITKAIKDENYKAQILGIEKEKAAKLKGKITLVVQNINRTIAANIDKDLFNKVFGEGVVKNEKEFKAKVAESITNNYTREAESILWRDIHDKVIDATKMDLPNEFLKRWMLRTNEGKISEKDLDKEYDVYA